jgi:hypothetical protein
MAKNDDAASKQMMEGDLGHKFIEVLVADIGESMASR